MPKYRFDDIAINSTEKKKPTEDDRFTYLGLEHLDSGSLKVTRYGSEVAPIGEKLVMHQGDVLFGKRRAYQKKVAIAPFDGIFSAHGMVLKPKEKVIDKNFFPLFISSDYFLDAAIKISVGSLSPTINWRDLKELEFTLPALETQRKLADVLWAMNDTMEAYKNLLAATDDMVKARFVEMFGTYPLNEKGWTTGTIRDLVMDVRYGSSRKSAEDDSGKYPYLRMNNITYDGELDLTDIKTINIPDKELENCTVRRGDLLFNRTNSKELVGKTCVYNRDETMVLAGFIVRVRLNEHACPEFVSAFLNMDFSKKMLFNMCKSAIGQANINAQELQNIEIYIPPIKLQNKFILFKEQVDKSKSELRKVLTELTALYKRILQDNLV